MTRGVADPVGALWPFLRAIEASIPARIVTLAAADLDSVEAVPDGQEEIVQFKVSAWGADGRGDGRVRAALESEAVDPKQAVLGGHEESSQDRDRRSGGPAVRGVGNGHGEFGVLDGDPYDRLLRLRIQAGRWRIPARFGRRRPGEWAASGVGSGAQPTI